ncbi:hypothetical protein D3C72_1710640 [compost metagenome]
MKWCSLKRGSSWLYALKDCWMNLIALCVMWAESDSSFPERCAWQQARRFQRISFRSVLLKVISVIPISILCCMTGHSNGCWRAFVRGMSILGLLSTPVRSRILSARWCSLSLSCCYVVTMTRWRPCQRSRGRHSRGRIWCCRIMRPEAAR